MGDCREQKAILCLLLLESFKFNFRGTNSSIFFCLNGKDALVKGIFVVHYDKSFQHVNSNRDHYLLALACANEHCPEKSEHVHLSLMKTFTMNLDFLGNRSLVDHVKMLRFLVSHGIRIFIFCGVELP